MPESLGVSHVIYKRSAVTSEEFSSREVLGVGSLARQMCENIAMPEQTQHKPCSRPGSEETGCLQALMRWCGVIFSIFCRKTERIQSKEVNLQHKRPQHIEVSLIRVVLGAQALSDNPYFAP